MEGSNIMGDALCKEFGALTVSKRLIRRVSQKLRIVTQKSKSNEDEIADGSSFSCLGRGWGHKVMSKVGQDIRDQRSKRSSVSERRDKTNVILNSINALLPDDILEMCLMKLPLLTLMTARLVCRKWNELTKALRFMQKRREGSYETTPWLFMFGIVKDRHCSGEIHALDVALGQWHTLKPEILEGRVWFSVASINDEIFIVGGRPSFKDFGKLGKRSFKDPKTMLVFSPSTKSWRMGAPMRHARSSPVLGISGVSIECALIHGQSYHQDRSFLGVASNVYEDTQRRRYVLIAVGGYGCWDETLDTGEIYDSLSKKWTKMPQLPVNFGRVFGLGLFARGFSSFILDMKILQAITYKKDTGSESKPSPLHLHLVWFLDLTANLFHVTVSCSQYLSRSWTEKLFENYGSSISSVTNGGRYQPIQMLPSSSMLHLLQIKT